MQTVRALASKRYHVYTTTTSTKIFLLHAKGGGGVTGPPGPPPWIRHYNSYPILHNLVSCYLPFYFPSYYNQARLNYPNQIDFNKLKIEQLILQQEYTLM